LEVNVLKNIYKKKLVDKMNVIRQLKMMETCEDCIFGKMHVWAYDEEVIHEKVLL